MDSRIRRLLATMLLVAWAVAIPLLSPLPPTALAELTASYQATASQIATPGEASKQSVRTDEIAKQINFVSKGVWLSWLLKAGLILAGVAAAAAAMRGLAIWPLIATTTSVVYIFTWLLRYETTTEPITERWSSWANATLNSGNVSSILSFLTIDLLLPLFHLCLVLALLLFWRSAARSSA